MTEHGLSATEQFTRELLERYKAAAEDSPIAGFRALFGGSKTKTGVLEEAQRMAPLLHLGAQVEGSRRQDAILKLREKTDARNAETAATQQRLEFLDKTIGWLDKYGGASPDQQIAIKPLLSDMLMWGAKKYEMDMTPEDIDAILNQPDLARQLKAVVGGDPAWSPDLQEEVLGLMGRAKSTEEKIKGMQYGQGKADSSMSTVMRNRLPEYAAEVRTRLGIPEGQRIPLETFQAEFRKDAPTRWGELITSRTARAQWAVLMKDDEALAGAGIQGPKAIMKGEETLAETAAKGPKDFSPSQVGLPAELAGFIQQTPQWKALAKGGVTMREWNDNTKVPPDVRQELLSSARILEKGHLGDITARQGEAGLVTAEQVKEKLPLIRTMPNHHIVERKTGQFVDRTGLSQKELTALGGEKTYAILDKAETQAYRNIVEARVIMDQYTDIAAKLVKMPGANLAQRFDTTAKTFLGIPNIGVDLDSMKGSILRIAGALQGSRVQLSDADVRAVSGMIPTVADSTGTAMQRLGNVTKILDVMKRVALGDVPNSTLHDLITQTRTPTRVKVGAPIR